MLTWGTSDARAGVFLRGAREKRMDCLRGEDNAKDSLNIEGLLKRVLNLCCS